MSQTLNTVNLIQNILRWKQSRVHLFKRLDSLERENERVRSKLTTLQHEKDQAERQADERRREKEALRVKLSSQKKAAEATDRVIEQLNAKITELRDEIDRQNRTHRKK